MPHFFPKISRRTAYLVLRRKVCHIRISCLIDIKIIILEINPDVTKKSRSGFKNVGFDRILPFSSVDFTKIMYVVYKKLSKPPKVQHVAAFPLPT
uniref:Uncharacterized protein n=1 Tax=Arundo donax TaxID=35708 RepID=A0A0A9HN71_ARUDO